MVDSSGFIPQGTERLLLDNFNTRDGKRWMQIASEYEISRYVTGAYVTSLDEAYENVIFYRDNNGQGDFYLAIRKWLPNEKGILVGAIIANRPQNDDQGKTLEIAYLIGNEFRGNGYMQEALKGFIHIAKNAGYNQLRFEVNSGNLASKKIVRKLNAVFVMATKNERYQETINLYVLNLNQI